MKNLVVLAIIITLLNSCKDQKRYIPDLTEFQKELNSSFKDVTKSPLSKNDRLDFISLDFFDFDSSYVVKAVLTPYLNDSIFDMKTNTDRMHTYNKYGKIKKHKTPQILVCILINMGFLISNLFSLLIN